MFTSDPTDTCAIHDEATLHLFHVSVGFVVVGVFLGGGDSHIVSFNSKDTKVLLSCGCVGVTACTVVVYFDLQSRVCLCLHDSILH